MKGLDPITEQLTPVLTQLTLKLLPTALGIAADIAPAKTLLFKKLDEVKKIYFDKRSFSFPLYLFSFPPYSFPFSISFSFLFFVKVVQSGDEKAVEEIGNVVKDKKEEIEGKINEALQKNIEVKNSVFMQFCLLLFVFRQFFFEEKFLTKLTERCW